MVGKETAFILLIILSPLALGSKTPVKPKVLAAFVEEREVSDPDGGKTPKEEMREKIATMKKLLDDVSSLAKVCGLSSVDIAKGLERSAIVGKNNEHLANLAEFLKSVAQSGHHWELCWRASRDGWASTQFHTLCDKKGPTVTIIKVDSYIFGGYTSASWDSSSCVYNYDSKPFIFSLVNKPGWAPVKLSPPGEAGSKSYNSAINSCSFDGPIFGHGHDIHIADKASSNTMSFTNLGWTYRAPCGQEYGSTFTKTFLAGTYYFQPDEIEVFYEAT